MRPYNSYVHSRYVSHRRRLWCHITIRSHLQVWIMRTFMSHDIYWRLLVYYFVAIFCLIWCNQKNKPKNEQLVPIKRFISCLQILGTNCPIKQYNVVFCVWSSCSQPLTLALVCSLSGSLILKNSPEGGLSMKWFR